MENSRKDNNTEESGIALVTALIITLLTLVLIAGINFILIKGFTTTTINRVFATAQEAAAGGVEYATGVIKNINTAGAVPQNMGTDPNALNVIYYCNAGPQTSNINVKTADGDYTINIQITCSKSPIPGSGGALTFPPPPGGGSMPPSTYCFYAITSQATKTTGSEQNTIGRVEAVYRYAR